MTATFPIDKIKIGHQRFRKDMGNIAEVVESIRDLGVLMNPINILADGTLVAGERRLAAAKQLGWTAIPVTFVDAANDIAKYEAAENFVRKDFTLSEAVAIRRELEPQAKREARERQAQAGGSAPGKLPEAVKTGEARDKVAKLTGFGARTLDKAAAVVAAAEAEPAKFGKLLADMDRTQRVNGVFRRMRVIQQAEVIRREPPPLPRRGPYRVIVADPPWITPVRAEDPSHRAALPYPGMSIDAICALDVASIAHADAILWLWATNANMRDSFRVLDAWGFHPKTILTWVKPHFGLGDWLRGQTEHCLLAVRGHPTVVLTNQSTVLHAPLGEHSQKPDGFYALVEALCPAPRYAELFARRKRPGWDGHGDEVAREAAE